MVALDTGVTIETGELKSVVFQKNSGVLTLLELDDQSTVVVEKPHVNTAMKYYFKNKQ